MLSYRKPLHDLQAYIPDIYGKEKRKRTYSKEKKLGVEGMSPEVILEALKKSEKDGDISEDEHRRLSDEVQKVTDTHIKKIDENLASKQKDIMQV